MFDVRRVDGEIYLDATLTQRSNDMLVAHHINAMQYVAPTDDDCQALWLEGWEVLYFINNLHIYDNQFEQAEELPVGEPSRLSATLGFECTRWNQFLLTSNQKILNWSIMIQ